ncbi:YdjY domain-containing protein [Luteolibacter arcticus]|uniref:YdjY domain-containing protein n=1 Tax=Luteolibacter arcticus TaxID=1581411 RepID=A0ABT3GNJ0_9BACT|nr:YdjY domain-containing protein [Luteolibacter arcticus]MCW1925046.1 YdjY domain-containing protein [Luteolibacter arcticus]
MKTLLLPTGSAISPRFPTIGSRAWVKCVVIAGLSVSALPLAAQNAVPADKGSLTDSGKFQPKDAAAAAAAVPNPAARLAELGVKLEGDRMQIGLVELDRKTHTVSFPAKVHAVEGLIEYLLVNSKGKVHETLFVTEAEPQDIHVACLLAGWGKKDAAPVLIEASWESNGPLRREPVENLVAFAKDHPQGETDGHLTPGSWTYTGSTIDAGGFAATREGSVVSLINDPAALVTNPRPGRDDDTLHVPNGKLLPAAGFPIKISLRPAPEKKD